MVGERIKKLRKVLELTQQEFSERIGIKRNTIAKYETNRGEPIDAVISLICREFNVNETWLRIGEGEMFDSTPETELDALAGKYHLSNIGRALIGAYIQLSEVDRASVDRYVGLLAAGVGPARLAAPASEAARGADQSDQTLSREEKPVTDRPLTIDEQVELYRQQLLLEEEQDKKASSANESGAG